MTAAAPPPGRGAGPGGAGALVVDVPDFPEPGIVFKDITPLLADHAGFAAVVEALAATGRDADGPHRRRQRASGIEARGFILAAPVALALGVGFVPVRKAGKLPRGAHAVSYSLEYGEAALELHRDALRPGERVLLVDDVLATGGTAPRRRRPGAGRAARASPRRRADGARLPARPRRARRPAAAPARSSSERP